MSKIILSCSNVEQEDLELIAHENNFWEALENSNVLVTGATGMVCSQIIKSILIRNRIYNSQITVYALVRSKDKFDGVFNDFLNDIYLKYVITDITKEININEKVDYIIHGASATKSKYFINNPVETIDVNVLGTKNILELANNKKIKGMVYLSTMEVYGKKNNYIKPLTVDKIGYINPLEIRSSYPESKKLCESYCISYYSQRNVPVNIARLCQTFGPGATKDDNRVYMQFAKSIINNEPIILHTKGKSKHNFCYLRDAVIGILLILTKGKKGYAYNVSNKKEFYSIKKFAKITCGLSENKKLKVLYNLNKTHGYAKKSYIKMDSKDLEKLGWSPSVSLKSAMERMIESIKHNN